MMLKTKTSYVDDLLYFAPAPFIGKNQHSARLGILMVNLLWSLRNLPQIFARTAYVFLIIYRLISNFYLKCHSLKLKFVQNFKKFIDGSFPTINIYTITFVFIWNILIFCLCLSLLFMKRLMNEIRLD